MKLRQLNGFFQVIFSELQSHVHYGILYNKGGINDEQPLLHNQVEVVNFKKGYAHKFEKPQRRV